MSQIPFLVETSRVLEILSKQIYDSPYAMARENVQNAFDAVLMRAKREGEAPSEYSIEIVATPANISIKDQGIGIPEGDVQHIFEPFFRASNTGKFEGHGVGLPLALNIVRLHKGSIAIASKVDAGTTIRVMLPVHTG